MSQLMLLYRFEHIGLENIEEELLSDRCSGKLVFLEFDSSWHYTDCQRLCHIVTIALSKKTYGMLCDSWNLYLKSLDEPAVEQWVRRKSAIVVTDFPLKDGGKVLDQARIQGVQKILDRRTEASFTTVLCGNGLSYEHPDCLAWGLRSEVVVVDVPEPKYKPAKRPPVFKKRIDH